MAIQENTLVKKVINSFSDGVDLYSGVRQVKDGASPNSTNCDFKGKTGVGNRGGYTQVQTIGDYDDVVRGMATYSTNSTTHQLIKFASKGGATDLALNYTTYSGGVLQAWTEVAGTTFASTADMNVVQASAFSGAAYTGAAGTLFSFNGTDTMVKYAGSSWAAHTGAATLLYGAFYDGRLWGVDPTYKDVLKFSTKTPDATQALNFATDGTSSKKGSITFTPGAGVEIVALKTFKGYLYVFTRNEIYSVFPASQPDTFTISLVTGALGCVSHRSVEVVENDLYFASLDGVYTIGDVATFTTVRANNRSLPISPVYAEISGTNKAKMVGRYFNFKYHLFYSLGGTANDSCFVYDIRYKAWQDWRNIAANDAVVFKPGVGGGGDIISPTFYFGHPTNGKVFQLYDGSLTDDGTNISSEWHSKSYDYGEVDVMKLFFDSTFVFGVLTGQLRMKIVMNDLEVVADIPVVERKGQGGFGAGAFGRFAFGDGFVTFRQSQNTNNPLRIKAKGQKFAIQYRITSTDEWRLDSTSQTYIPFDHFKFPAINKLN